MKEDINLSKEKANPPQKNANLSKMDVHLTEENVPPLKVDMNPSKEGVPLFEGEVQMRGEARCLFPQPALGRPPDASDQRNADE